MFVAIPGNQDGQVPNVSHITLATQNEYLQNLAICNKNVSSSFRRDCVTYDIKVLPIAGNTVSMCITTEGTR